MLGSFYEKAWDFGRESQASPTTCTHNNCPSTQNANSPANNIKHASPRTMHLTETMQLNGGGGLPVGQGDVGTAWSKGVEQGHGLADVNEAIVPIPEQCSQDTLIVTLVASWVLLVHRYQRDSFHNITWATEVARGLDHQFISAQELDLERVVTSADLFGIVEQLSREKRSRCEQNTSIVFNDGDRDEWTYQVTTKIQKSRIHMTSEWRPPTMARHQAIGQLKAFSSIVCRLLDERFYPICNVSELCDDELEEIWNWNHPLRPPIETCMHDLVSEQARLNPEKIAVESWDGDLTYAQVERFSTALAQNLLLLDDKQTIVPLLFEKSRWTIVSVLAVMKAGMCFTLLDPAQPEGRLRTIVEQTNATLMVTSKKQSALATRVASTATIIPISESRFSKLYSPFAVQQPSTSLPTVSPSKSLYIQFTSGSTGKPKGCIISHSQYTSGAIPRAFDVGYRSNSRVLDFASYAFDVCIDSMLCTLAHGGTLCTPSDEQRMNDLSGAMRELKVTLAGMTPSVARTLDADILDQLGSIALGGEGVSASDAASWGKQTKIINAYGPSECTVGATINADVGAKPYITMGKGKGCATWVVHPSNHHKLVPIGAVGELLIEGPIVGDGYINNPQKTKEVFIEDPEFLLNGSRKVPGRRGRMYKTGDLVRYDPDGNGEVIFVGRQDQQVKLRGQRIELAEIEYNMQRHLPSDTMLAAEVIKPGGSADEVLVAFLVEQRQTGIRHLDGNIFASFSSKFQESLNEMTRNLGQDLPSYMVPSAYIPLWRMPLLVSCKTDRKRLREIGVTISRKDLRHFSAAISEKIEPTTEMELALRPLWAKILGGDSDFGANDNFFSMGGDSLRAMRLVAAARCHNILLSVPDIMLHPTLSAMSKRAKAVTGASQEEIDTFSLLPSDWHVDEAKAEVAPLCDIRVESIEDMYPCTPLQEGLMALSAKFTDAYVAQRVVELPPEVARKLGHAFFNAITDCPILRSRIVNVPGRGLFQVVIRDEHAAHEGTDLQEYLFQDRNTSMELGKPLFRYAVITSPGSDVSHVVTTMHHAIYDGWSMPLVVERVNRAYSGQGTERPADFKHFIRHLSSLERPVTEQYWRKRLQNASPHQFPPLPHKGYTMRADSLLEHYVTVPTSAHSQTTLATIIRGAWALVSSLYMGHSDTIFGETLTGRSASVSGIEQIEGPMITTVPVRIHTNRESTVAQYLHEIHAATVQQIPHEHLGLQNIRRLSPEARVACDLRTGLVLHPKEDQQWGDSPTLDDAPANGFVPADDAEAAREALKFNTYALMLVCTLDANGFLVMASFDSNCVSPAVMARVLAVLDRIVTKFCGNPEHLLGDVAVLDSEEKEDAEKIRPTEVSNNDEMETEPSKTVSSKATAANTTFSIREVQLRNLLARILNMELEEIEFDSSFFELGGDSITAMRLVSEARAQGLTMTVAQIFQSHSLSALATMMESEKERKLHKVLSQVLGLPESDIDLEVSFFELGGDSIGAMRLVSEARSQRLKISVAQIFQSKSLSSLAQVAEETSEIHQMQAILDTPFTALGNDRESVTPATVHHLLQDEGWKIKDIYPARPLQQLAVEGTVGLPRYSLRYEMISFKTPIDEPQLLSSCQALVARNEALRTVFVLQAGQVFGVVLESLRAPFEHISVPENAEVHAMAKEFTSTDIESPKPHGSSFVAFTLFTSSTTRESVLVFRISHAQYDEICLPILYDQLAALYGGTVIPTTEPFTKHVNHVTMDNIPRSIPYWQNLLADSQMSILRPSIPLATQSVIDVYREFDISSRPNGITIGSLPTAAWAVVLANRLSTRDVVFGEVVSGRNIGVPSADRIFGPTWQYIPFRVRFNSSWTYRDLLQHVQHQHIESAAFEGMGFKEIVDNCTNWNAEEVSWFDTVVHQAPQWVESMNFGTLQAHFQTIYPHQEPLREWKCQAFVKDGGKKLGIEIVTFEDWASVAEEVLGEVGAVLRNFVGRAEGKIFDVPIIGEDDPSGSKVCLEDFEGVM